MPIEKLGNKVWKTDTDPSSITLNIRMQKTLCCSECGETSFTLLRVKGADGKKFKPARYICKECYKNARV